MWKTKAINRELPPGAGKQRRQRSEAGLACRPSLFLMTHSAVVEAVPILFTPENLKFNGRYYITKSGKSNDEKEERPISLALRMLFRGSGNGIRRSRPTSIFPDASAPAASVPAPRIRRSSSAPDSPPPLRQARAEGRSPGSSSMRRSAAGKPSARRPSQCRR